MPEFVGVYDMLNCSLNELLHVAKYGIETKKAYIDNAGHGEERFGFPAAILLFAIADTIGSAFENIDYKINIGGEEKTINTDGFQHFYIFDSEFYNLDLSEEMIRQIYTSYRCLLVHNSSISAGHFLDVGTEQDSAFVLGRTSDGEIYPVKVNLVPFYNMSVNAVNEFLQYYRRNNAELAVSRLVFRIDRDSKIVDSIQYITSATTGRTEWVEWQPPQEN